MIPVLKINKDNHGFVVAVISHNTKKVCHFRWQARNNNIGQMEFWTFSKVNDKIYTNYFPRVVSNTKGYKEKEPCHIGFEQLQTSQLEERALQSNNIYTFPQEITFSQNCQHALPFLIANISRRSSKQQDTHILCQTGYNQPIMVSIQSVGWLIHSMTFTTCLYSSAN